MPTSNENMKRTLAALLAAFALTTFVAPTSAANVQRDRQKIHDVVETFRMSIIKKDSESFLKLFLKPDIPWIAVSGDKTLARQIASQKTNSQMPKPGKLLPADNPKDFIDWISNSQEPIEETFANVRIDTDGDIAQVWFDYSFKVAGYKQNWGKEAWHMVKTEDGWKISSVIVSSELNPVPPPGRGIKP